MARRWSVLMQVALALAFFSTPSDAAYVRLWHQFDYFFPEAFGTKVAPLPPSFIGDTDGDGRDDCVGVSGNQRSIAVRDCITGSLEGLIDVYADLAMNVHAINVTRLEGDATKAYILATLTNGSVLTGFAVYGWVPSAGTPGPLISETGALMPAVPNPFASQTVITFSLATEGRAELEVFDVSGRSVRTLVNGTMSAGQHRVDWDGKDASGRRLSAGTYFYSLRLNGTEVESRRAIVVY